MAGPTEYLGSDGRAAEAAIRSMIMRPKAKICIGESEGVATIDIGPLPPGTARKAAVFAAYAIDSGTQDVVRGENKGRRLHPVAIAKQVKQIAAVDDRREFKTKLPLERGVRLIVSVQELGNGTVWAVAMHPASR